MTGELMRLMTTRVFRVTQNWNRHRRAILICTRLFFDLPVRSGTPPRDPVFDDSPRVHVREGQAPSNEPVFNSDPLFDYESSIVDSNGVRNGPGSNRDQRQSNNSILRDYGMLFPRPSQIGLYVPQGDSDVADADKDHDSENDQNLQEHEPDCSTVSPGRTQDNSPWQENSTNSSSSLFRRHNLSAVIECTEPDLTKPAHSHGNTGKHLRNIHQLGKKPKTSTKSHRSISQRAMRHEDEPLTDFEKMVLAERARVKELERFELENYRELYENDAALSEARRKQSALAKKEKGKGTKAEKRSLRYGIEEMSPVAGAGKKKKRGLLKRLIGLK
ncbi:hypothetical protein BCR34DRAFT_585055 [Clohesyomyces aquaticus]|uniref:Uncharacterized protein n=1 Tax=Clohesyomyces aquaticus TaxID=1231657 RepID=A0A1Y1ZYT9_9PLEO|nr:hypothetical protein BCR34DRAFT_585055 [Clohesyomyces aquaticus]